MSAAPERELWYRRGPRPGPYAPRMADDDNAKPERSERGRLIAAVILVGVIAALAIDNYREVKIGYVLGDARVHLVYLLLVTALLGAAAGYLARSRRKR